MKKLFFLVTVLAFFTIGCGGGGGSTTPSVHDLTGLAGVWDYVMIVDGQITGPGGSVTLKETFTGYYIINTNSVIDDEGDPWVWSYNGSTLTIEYAGSGSFWDPDCGDIYATQKDKASIPLVPGATVGNVSGTIDVTFNTDLCGELTGVLPITGTMTKR
jgi:hypothetical protein